MKRLNLLVWITQLGLSVAAPLVIGTLAGVWLHSNRGWGRWAVWAGLALGVFSAVGGLRDSLRAMERLTRGEEKKKEEPPVSFNDHD